MARSLPPPSCRGCIPRPWNATALFTCIPQSGVMCQFFWQCSGTNLSRRQSATTVGASADHARVCLAAPPQASAAPSGLAVNHNKPRRPVRDDETGALDWRMSTALFTVSRSLSDDFYTEGAQGRAVGLACFQFHPDRRCILASACVRTVDENY